MAVHRSEGCDKSAASDLVLGEQEGAASKKPSRSLNRSFTTPARGLDEDDEGSSPKLKKSISFLGTDFDKEQGALSIGSADASDRCSFSAKSARASEVASRKSLLTGSERRSVLLGPGGRQLNRSSTMPAGEATTLKMNVNRGRTSRLELSGRDLMLARKELGVSAESSPSKPNSGGSEAAPSEPSPSKDDMHVNSVAVKPKNESPPSAHVSKPPDEENEPQPSNNVEDRKRGSAAQLLSPEGPKGSWTPEEQHRSRSPVDRHRGSMVSVLGALPTGLPPLCHLPRYDSQGYECEEPEAGESPKPTAKPQRRVVRVSTITFAAETVSEIIPPEAEKAVSAVRWSAMESRVVKRSLTAPMQSGVSGTLQERAAKTELESSGGPGQRRAKPRTRQMTLTDRDATFVRGALQVGKVQGSPSKLDLSTDVPLQNLNLSTSAVVRPNVSVPKTDGQKEMTNDIVSDAIDEPKLFSVTPVQPESSNRAYPPLKPGTTRTASEPAPFIPEKHGNALCEKGTTFQESTTCAHPEVDPSIELKAESSGSQQPSRWGLVNRVIGACKRLLRSRT